MSDLIDAVNRLRAKGYSYIRVAEILQKMGNSKEQVDSAISAYVSEILS